MTPATENAVINEIKELLCLLFKYRLPIKNSYFIIEAHIYHFHNTFYDAISIDELVKSQLWMAS